MYKSIILLIEDNVLDEKLTLRALKQSEILPEVCVVRDGPEALEFLFYEGRYAQSPHPLPLLILLDLKLPKLSGLDVLKKIRLSHILQATPIIILTSSIEDKDITACYDLGANSYLRKQVDFLNFTQTIKSMSQYWLTHNQIPKNSQ